MIMGELQALKRLDHPLIVSLHFAFQDRQFPSLCSLNLVTISCREKCFFIMDLKTGGDLRYYLRKKVVFEENDVAFYVACISSALQYIHSRNIIHRDVKPGELPYLLALTSNHSPISSLREYYPGRAWLSAPHRLRSSTRARHCLF